MRSLMSDKLISVSIGKIGGRNHQERGEALTEVKRMKSRAKRRVGILAEQSREIPQRIVELGQNEVFFDCL